MAIEWYSPANHKGVTKDTYEGRVIRTYVRRDVRIMSDVWADLYYAEVWTGSSVESVSTGASGMSHDAKSVVVDATPETLAAVAAWREAEAERKRLEWEAKAPEREAARLKAEARDRKRRLREAKAYLNTPEKGSTVTVARRRGRNAPPLGTSGVVFWTGFSNMGTPRVGFKDPLNETHWTTVGNCDVVLPEGAPTDADDLATWEAYVEKIKAERADATTAKAEAAKKRSEIELDALPEIGSWVRHKSDPSAFGCIFWRGVTEKGIFCVGFKPDKSSDAHWAGFRKGVCVVELLTGDPRKGGVPVASGSGAGSVTVAEAAAAAAPVAPVSPAPVSPAPVSPAPVAPAPVSPLAHLPAPFCDIAEVRGFRAYAADGSFIATLPAPVAEKISSALSAA